MAAICAERRTLAVSGTHGKTTTTAMLTAVLSEAGYDPSYLVGGELPGGDGGAYWGSSQWLVVEADEADGTFLQLGAHGVVVTNVEPDHLDYLRRRGGLARGLRGTSSSRRPGPASFAGTTRRRLAWPADGPRMSPPMALAGVRLPHIVRRAFRQRGRGSK